MEPNGGDSKAIRSSEHRLFIAGIGAPAGDLDALERLLETVPGDAGVAWILIPDVALDLSGLLPERLARFTSRPVLQGEDGMEVEPGHVYLLPPGGELVVSGGRLRLAGEAEVTVPGRDPGTAGPASAPPRSRVDLGDASLAQVELLTEELRHSEESLQDTHHQLATSKEAEERAQEAVRRWDAFLATLSHELRNPLDAILGSVHLLDDARSSDDVKARARDVIRRQAAQMSRLLGDLLDVSRVARDKIELDTGLVDLRRVLDEAVGAVESHFARRGLRLDTQVPEGPVFVSGDRVRLQQICVNLLSNAAKFSRPGGQVRFRVRAAGGEAVVEVADDGVGLDADVLESIFEPFVQVDGDAREGGMGLGLPLVRSLTAMHGGTVTAASDGPGRGAVFTVRLPRMLEGVEERPPEAAPAVIPRGTRIVVVEDMADNRDALTDFLEMTGFEVHGAADGPSGAELIERLRPPIALVDVGLPGLDGYGVARRIRARVGSDIRLVALTGYGRREDRREAAEAGFDAHVVKPVDAPELEAVLARLLGS